MNGWDAESAIAEPAANSPVYTELTAFGVTKGITDWTRDRRCKVSSTGIQDRLRRGWSVEEAIATPPHRRPRR